MKSFERYFLNLMPIVHIIGRGVSSSSSAVSIATTHRWGDGGAIQHRTSPLGSLYGASEGGDML